MGPDAAAIEARIRAKSFEVLGWLDDAAGLDIPGRALVLIGNAGPSMFARFASERDPDRDLMDDWTRDVLSPLADSLGAQVVFPFDVPHPPFLTWARAAGAGFTSPLGMNIHPQFGLWHAYRGAIIFNRPVAVSSTATRASPCEDCTDKPCLQACPVDAFTPGHYDVEACAGHLRDPAGEDCRSGGCRARNACPVARRYVYSPEQIRFHMVAFMKARGVDPATIG